MNVLRLSGTGYVPISESNEESEEQDNQLVDFSSSTVEEENSNDQLQDNEIQLQHQFHYFPIVDYENDTESKTETGLPSRPGSLLIILMACCPCLTNNPCSTDKKQEYKNITKTTVFFISIAQVSKKIFTLVL